MTNVTMKLEQSQPQTDAAVHLFDNWFDPIEAGLRDRVREFIHAMVEGELDTRRAARWCAISTFSFVATTRISCTGLLDDIDVRKTIFGFDAEQPIVVAKISPANVHYICRMHVSAVCAPVRSGVEAEFCR